MLRLFRVLGKRGRITIPFEIRQRIGFKYNDVLSFTQQDDGSVVVRREKICDNCKYLEEDFEENFTLEDFIDSLSEEEQRDALVHLSLKWVEKQNVSLPFASAKKEVIISWYSKISGHLKFFGYTYCLKGRR